MRRRLACKKALAKAEHKVRIVKAKYEEAVPELKD